MKKSSAHNLVLASVYLVNYDSTQYLGCKKGKGKENIPSALSFLFLSRKPLPPEYNFSRYLSACITKGTSVTTLPFIQGEFPSFTCFRNAPNIKFI